MAQHFQPIRSPESTTAATGFNVIFSLVRLLCINPEQTSIEWDLKIATKCKAQPKARKLMTTCHWHWSPAAGCNLNCSEKILIAWYFQEGEITETNHYPAIIVIWKILSFPSHNCIKPWTRSSKINLQYKHHHYPYPYLHLPFWPHEEFQRKIVQNTFSGCRLFWFSPVVRCRVTY